MMGLYLMAAISLIAVGSVTANYGVKEPLVQPSIPRNGDALRRQIPQILPPKPDYLPRKVDGLRAGVIPPSWRRPATDPRAPNNSPLGVIPPSWRRPAITGPIRQISPPFINHKTPVGIPIDWRRNRPERPGFRLNHSHGSNRRRISKLVRDGFPERRGLNWQKQSNRRRPGAGYYSSG